MKIKDKALIVSGLIVLGMGLLLLITSCISKIPCDKDKFDPKQIYQDKIALLCTENEELKNENFILKMDFAKMKELLNDCNNKMDNEIKELERKLKVLENKAILLHEHLKNNENKN